MRLFEVLHDLVRLEHRIGGESHREADRKCQRQHVPHA